MTHHAILVIEEITFVNLDYSWLPAPHGVSWEGVSAYFDILATKQPAASVSSGESEIRKTFPKTKGCFLPLLQLQTARTLNSPFPSRVLPTTFAFTSPAEAPPCKS